MFGFGTSGKSETPPDYDTVSHASDLLKAASPYLSPDLLKSLNLFIKTFEFMHAVKEFSSPKKRAEDFHKESKIDFEGLLKSIRPHCTKEESEIVDLFLNMMSAVNFYKTYQEMTSMFADMQGNSSEQDEFNSDGMGNDDMFDTLMEMLSPEQKGTFETIKTLMDSGMLNQMFSQDPA